MTKFIDSLFSSLKTRPKIVFPEGENEIILQAANLTKKFIEPILLSGENSLARAAQLVADGDAQTMVAGIDFTSRDVILTTRDIIGMTGKTFSSSFIFDFTERDPLILADVATCKNPSVEQLVDIILQTVELAKKILLDDPRVAMLSFSTLGSGGSDTSIDKIHQAISLVKKLQPELLIDGEMQLDAAINPRIGEKKASESPVAGRANVLIAPDLNSGNILYKAIEQFGGAHAYGPLLQGFNSPVSDLSRGSNLEDVLGVIAVTARRLEFGEK